METPGREGRDEKVGNSDGEQNPGQEAGELTWSCHLGYEGPLAGLWARGHQENHRGQTGRWAADRLSDVMFSQNDSALAPGI